MGAGKAVFLGVAAAAIAGLAAYGCGSSPPPGPVATGSAAFGIITVNGKQLMYLPLLESSPKTGDGQVAVVDVGQAGNGMSGANALVTSIDLGCPVSKVGGFCPQSDAATATAADADVVVAASSTTYRVWFIDPSNNSVTTTITLNPSPHQLLSSAGNFTITGVALDVANHRAIVSVSTGLMFVDLNSHSVTGSQPAPGSENFGYDPTRELVVAPFYGCTALDAGGCAQTGPAGADVVNLASGTAFAFQDPAATDPTHPFGSRGDPDAAAVDPSLQLALVTLEFGHSTAFLDLTSASYDSSAGTFTAPLTLLPMAGGGDEDGVAVEPVSHLAFFEQEFADTMAVVDLTQYGKGVDGGFAPSAQVEATVPDAPDGTAWVNLGDPHGVAVTTGLTSSKPVGFVVTDPGTGPVWVARVDLQQMLSLGSSAADGGLSATAVAAAVTMLNGATKE